MRVFNTQSAKGNEIGVNGAGWIGEALKVNSSLMNLILFCK